MKILGFGLNSGGQLVSADHNVRLPVPIPVNLEGIAINRIGAAGDQSFIGLTSASSLSDCLKFQMKEIKSKNFKFSRRFGYREKLVLLFLNILRIS